MANKSSGTQIRVKAKDLPAWHVMAAAGIISTGT